MVEGLPDGRAALVIKVHHSMTDGVGGMKLLLMLFDLEREVAEQGPDPDPVTLPVFTPLGLLGQSLAYQQRRFGDSAMGVFEGVRGAVRALRDDPEHAIERGVRAAESVARYLAPAPTPMSPLIDGRSLQRRLTTLDVQLDELKHAAKAADGTLNDAFVAAVLGGLRRYHDEHDTPCDELRMIMPINLRGEGDALGGNHFTPARMLVPMAIRDPVERIQVVGERARQLRAEPAVGLTQPMAAVLNRVPRRLATLLFGGMLKGADFVTSNLPGAPFPMYVCGSEVQRIYAFAPLSGTAANITLLSHCGTCCIGINTDVRAIPDTAQFRDAIDAGFDEVLA
jgi:WS/DGAT/MGAT family acyltransferase